MRKICMLGILALLLPLAGLSQNPSGAANTSASFPAVEVFGGFSYLRLDTTSASTLNAALGLPPGTLSVKKNYPGWNGALQFNINRWLGLVADASGHYGTPVSSSSISGLPSASFHNFLFGPVLTMRRNRAQPFVHALFGVEHLAVDASSVQGTAALSDNAFSSALGGGLDIRVSRRLGVRLVQADYLYTKHDTTSFGGVGHQNNIRISTGIMFLFGRRE
jgi:outer membrane immunogenic protein